MEGNSLAQDMLKLAHYTDSVVLSYPLPEGFVSSTELGKFKLEHHVKEGISLAPIPRSTQLRAELTLGLVRFFFCLASGLCP